MAQPYYDDGHPLEEYLTGAQQLSAGPYPLLIVPHSHVVAELVGEAPEQMPGSHPIFSLMHHAHTEPPVLFKYSDQVEKLCFIIFGLLQVSPSFVAITPFLSSHIYILRQINLCPALFPPVM